MTLTTATLRILLVLPLLFAGTLSASAKGSDPGYQTGFIRWRAADSAFSGWTTTSVVLPGGIPTLDLTTAPTQNDPLPLGGYYGGNYYNGASFKVGEITSPELTTPFLFSEAIASWNALTPPGTWIETQIRAQVGGAWTKWYSLGIWASDSSAVTRHSVKLQGDNDGFVAVDTLVLTNNKLGANAYQLNVRLFSQNTSVPSLRNLSLTYSSTPPKKVTLQPGNPALWGTLLAVPECSQMVYPDGGEVWCSPTSTSMVLQFLGTDLGPGCEPDVRAAVDGVFDWIYDGHGNWPFNTAYAANFGYEGYVVRMTSLAQAELWIAAGVPVVVSFAWGKGDLAGAAIPSSGGHLAVLVGFDAAGNPIINDPAAASDAEVQRTYNRAEFETLWLKNSGGTVYLIYPPDWAVPAL